MELLKQTDPRLYKEINLYGCFFMSILAAVQLFKGKALNSDQINEAWKLAIKKGYLVEDEGGFYQLSKPHMVGSMVGDPEITTFANVKIIPGWEPTWYTGHTFIILKGQTSTGTHYRLGDHEGLCIYDPMPTVQIKKELTKEYYLVQ